jgi:hypothetical protein
VAHGLSCFWKANISQKRGIISVTVELPGKGAFAVLHTACVAQGNALLHRAVTLCICKIKRGCKVELCRHTLRLQRKERMQSKVSTKSDKNGNERMKKWK